jgi:GMP synthase-like glutamine amidotransferase
MNAWRFSCGFNSHNKDTMRLHSLQHVPFEHLAAIAAWAHTRGWTVSTTHLYQAEPLPSPDELDWLVIMGGPMNIYEEERYPWLSAEKRFIARAVEAGKTVLGICLGAQLIADVLGAAVVKGPHPEIGWFPVIKDPAADHTGLGRVLPARFDAFHWHGDTFALPEGAVPLGRSEACACQGFIYNERVLALQFHLETTQATAEALVKHCGDEIGDGPFEQTAVEMLADPRRYDRLNALMKTLVDSLADRK